MLGMSMPHSQPFTPARALIMLRTCRRSVVRLNTVRSTVGRVKVVPASGQLSRCSTLMGAPRVFEGPTGWKPGGAKGRPDCAIGDSAFEGTVTYLSCRATASLLPLQASVVAYLPEGR